MDQITHVKPAVIEKAEVKRLTVKTVARRVEDLRESVSGDRHRLDGSIAGLKDVEKTVESVRNHFKQKIHEEGLALEQAKSAQDALDLVSGGLRNLLLKYESQKQQSIGAASMASKVMDYCQKVFDTEGAKAQAIMDALESGQEADIRPGSRPVGSKPGASIASMRRAEEAPVEDDSDALLRQAAELEEQENASKEATEKPADEPVERPKKKARKRRQT